MVWGIFDDLKKVFQPILQMSLVGITDITQQGLYLFDKALLTFAALITELWRTHQKLDGNCFVRFFLVLSRYDKCSSYWPSTFAIANLPVS